MARIFAVLLILPLVLLSGCAAMSETECVATDWTSVGFEDGVAGRTVAAIGNYRNACSRYGVTPDLTAYRSGHTDGVEVYCRAGRGFEVGHSGARYQGVCPASSEPTFLDAYSKGRHLYELESALRGIDGQISARYRRLDEIDHELKAIAAAMISDETTGEERAVLIVDTANKAREQKDIEGEIEGLEAERLLRQDDLLAYQETLAFDF
jgi:Protein of unknown function (DUF2799)